MRLTAMRSVHPDPRKRVSVSARFPDKAQSHAIKPREPERPGIGMMTFSPVRTTTVPRSVSANSGTPEKRDQFGQTVIDKIERFSPGFKDLIVHMEVRTPHEIENEIGLTEGNIFQGELTIDQLLFNRPFPGYAQYRMPVKNMYMCGSSTHPGGGVSSACGANAAREILRDLKRPNVVPEDDCYDE